MGRSKYKESLTQDILVNFTYEFNGEVTTSSVEMIVSYDVTVKDIAERIQTAHNYDKVQVISYTPIKINLGQVLYGEI